MVVNLIDGKLYVGKTILSIEERWQVHLRDARRGRGNSYLYKAIRKHGAESFARQELESELMDKKSLNAAEVRWIAELRTMDRGIGYNLTAGGEGGARGPETRAEMSASAFERWKRPEEIERLRAHQIALWADPAWRAMMLERLNEPEVKAKRVAAATGRKHSPETRAKIGAAVKKGLAKPEVRARLSASARKRMQDPATKASQSALPRSLWAEPATRERWLARMRSPENRARLREDNLGRKHSDKARAKMSASHKGLKDAPETRAKKSAKQKGHPVSEAVRAKISKKLMGHGLTKKTRAKISSTLRKNASAKRKRSQKTGNS